MKHRNEAEGNDEEERSRRETMRRNEAEGNDEEERGRRER